MKKTFSVLFAILIATGFFSGALAVSDLPENLIFNGNFELIGENGLPDGWYTEAYLNDPGYTSFLVTGDPEHGHAAVIRNHALNDARFAQVIDVLPDTLYKLSGFIRTKDVEEGHGANFSIEGLYSFSEEVFDTEDGWKFVEWYGETGPNQETVTLFIRLGGYSGESTGTAAFADITLVETDEVPGDDIAACWFRMDSPAYYEEDPEEGDEADEPFWPWLLLISLLYTAACACILSRVYEKSHSLSRTQYGWEGEKFIFAAGLLLALMLRIVISYFITGYQVDVNCFNSWGQTMSLFGPAGFYNHTSFCDYPPAYTYILGLNALICRCVSASDDICRVIFRLFPSFCDVAACWLLDWTLRDTAKMPNRRRRAFLLLLAFNPASVLNSAAWGQMDSVLCLLLLLVAILAVQKKWHLCLPCYMLAVLVKPQALMLGFLGLAALIQEWIRFHENRKSVLLGLGYSLAVFTAVVIPFSFHQDSGWLIRLYAGTLGSYHYATINAANLAYLLGGNWTSADMPAHWMSGVLMALLSASYGFVWLKGAGRNQKNRLTESVLSAAFTLYFLLCAALGAEWSWTGFGAMAFALMIVLSLYLRKGSIQFLPYLGALLFILLYVFGAKMHERYLFPALLLLYFSVILYQDRRTLWLLLVFSCTIFLNEGIVLDNSIRLGSSMGHLNQDTVLLADLIATINISSAILAVWTGLELFQDRRIPFVEFCKSNNLDGHLRSPFSYHPDSLLHWTPKDSIWMLLITLVYSAVSLMTLGSTKAPQSAWTSSSYEEEIIFDLGENVPEEYTMLYFAQVSRYDFSIEESNDLAIWDGDYWAQMDQGQCWKWKYLMRSWESGGARTFAGSGNENIIRLHQRYIRLAAHQIGLKLNEILFRDLSGNVLPAQIKARYGANAESELFSDPACLLDEQDTLEGLPALIPGTASGLSAEPSWWNSTYFDEIYHARTGFEFLHGTTPYETSHPPLGKVLIAAGIAAFGMTPFGWRFAGAMAGILMLPAIYLLCKQLTKKTRLAAAATMLMAMDCMHLTQTQIATIDSFPVLFILFSFYFMLRFLQRDILREKVSAILPDLAFSGFFMGLAIASKWIGIYAGAGLAVLFFWHCARHLRIASDAAELLIAASPKEEEKRFLKPYLPDMHGVSPVPRRIMVLCLWCLLFFVAVPLTIYLLSYIPYMAYQNSIRSLSDYLQAVWQAQIGMLSYHSTKGLGMDHPFYSPWWEWPIIGKPMFYATESYPVSDSSHFSIFCFGNPVVWLGGLAALIICAALWLKEKRNKDGSWKLINANYSNSKAFLLIGFLAQYLPWVLVPRGTYIYHYFASVPFLIGAMVLCADQFEPRFPKLIRVLTVTILILAASAFVIFFPYVSGLLTPVEWLNVGRSMLKIWY